MTYHWYLLKRFIGPDHLDKKDNGLPTNQNLDMSESIHSLVVLLKSDDYLHHEIPTPNLESLCHELENDPSMSWKQAVDSLNVLFRKRFNHENPTTKQRAKRLFNTIRTRLNILPKPRFGTYNEYWQQRNNTPRTIKDDEEEEKEDDELTQTYQELESKCSTHISKISEKLDTFIHLSIPQLKRNYNQVSTPYFEMTKAKKPRTYVRTVRKLTQTKKNKMMEIFAGLSKEQMEEVCATAGVINGELDVDSLDAETGQEVYLLLEEYNTQKRLKKRPVPSSSSVQQFEEMSDMEDCDEETAGEAAATLLVDSKPSTGLSKYGAFAYSLGKDGKTPPVPFTTEETKRAYHNGQLHRKQMLLLANEMNSLNSNTEFTAELVRIYEEKENQTITDDEFELDITILSQETLAAMKECVDAFKKKKKTTPVETSSTRVRETPVSVVPSSSARQEMDRQIQTLWEQGNFSEKLKSLLQEEGIVMMEDDWDAMDSSRLSQQTVGRIQSLIQAFKTPQSSLRGSAPMDTSDAGFVRDFECFSSDEAFRARLLQALGQEELDLKTAKPDQLKLAKECVYAYRRTLRIQELKRKIGGNPPC